MADEREEMQREGGEGVHLQAQDPGRQSLPVSATGKYPCCCFLHYTSYTL